LAEFQALKPSILVMTTSNSSLFPGWMDGHPIWQLFLKLSFLKPCQVGQQSIQYARSCSTRSGGPSLPPTSTTAAKHLAYNEHP